jgi:hypothetical protein
MPELSPRLFWCLILALIPLLGACADDRPYLEIGGGGFIFNYRNAQAHYGIILYPRKNPPAGAVIEATFDNPAGGGPIVLRREARGGGRIDFQTPPVTGVKKDTPYHVLVVLRAADGAELQRLERDFVSELDQTILPERPLAIGPGYQQNIDESATPFPPSLYVQPEEGAPR